MNFQWKGVFPALTTKFDQNESLDVDLFLKNLRMQMDAGIHGIVLGGTLGEASTLSLGEKETLVSCAVDYIQGSIPVILNIAEGSTKEAIKQVENAKKWGVNGLMILPPMRYKPDHRECITFFMDVAKASDLPIMIYNNPVDYKTEVTLDMFEAFVDVPNIQAIKESTRDVSNVTRLINRFGQRFKILSGVDTLAMESLLMGAHGWVAGLVCAFPKETVTIYELIQQSRFSEAREIYRWFLPLLELDIHTKLVQYIKLAESKTQMGSEFVRAPRMTLIGEERQKITDIIENAIKNRPQLPKI